MALITGLPQLRAALTQVSAQADLVALTVITKAAADVEAKAKANFEGAHRRGEPHVGGDKPNIVTGTLRRSITHDRIARVGPYSYGTRVGPTTIYARRVELGGTDSRGHTTRPFPYFAPAVADAQAGFAALAAGEWSRFLRG